MRSSSLLIGHVRLPEVVSDRLSRAKVGQKSWASAGAGNLALQVSIPKAPAVNPCQQVLRMQSASGLALCPQDLVDPPVRGHGSGIPRGGDGKHRHLPDGFRLDALGKRLASVRSDTSL
jgi:hypothetical protein